MKKTNTVKKELDIKTLLVKANVRYWEDSYINGKSDTEKGDNMPCKIGNLWCPEIEIETGVILNWAKGNTANIHYKVADELGYDLKDEKGDVVFSADDGYVPSTLCPKENGYGDYIIMDIDENGQIANWKFNLNDFEDSEN